MPAFRPHVAILGAGAFGGWTALELLRRGARVTLIDAWGPGNTKSSSGGATRIIRAGYGSHAMYTRLAARALVRWREHEALWTPGLLQQTGALWMFGEDASVGDMSAVTLRDEGIPFLEIELLDAIRQYPHVAFSGVRRVFVEPGAGYLHAARACAHVAARVSAEGGTCRDGEVSGPVRFTGRALCLAGGGTIEADAFVFACGPWLGRLFPDVIGDRIIPTRQEVYYFGTPPGDGRFSAPQLPVWLDATGRLRYGIPGDPGERFKIADDTTGPLMDPTTDERLPTAEGVMAVREFMAMRFPAMGDAALLRAEVCQYESTPDSHFILDRHPDDARVWIAGGGSGHGFKMGPVVGELMASLVLGQTEPDPQFGLARFAAPPAGGWRAKWS